MTPMMIPIELSVSTASAGGGGATLAIVGDATIPCTAIDTPVTLANMAVALLRVLIAVAIADCTKAAAAVGVRMRTPTMTLPGDMVNSTADGSTPAWAAVALFIWDCTLGVNEETSPARRRVNPTTLIGVVAVTGGGGGGGRDGDGGGGDGGGGGGVDGGDGGDGYEHTRQPVPVRSLSENHWIVPGPNTNSVGPPNTGLLPPVKSVNVPDGWLGMRRTSQAGQSP